VSALLQVQLNGVSRAAHRLGSSGGGRRPKSAALKAAWCPQLRSRLADYGRQVGRQAALRIRAATHNRLASGIAALLAAYLPACRTYLTACFALLQ
jgi:hypothetical protein